MWLIVTVEIVVKGKLVVTQNNIYFFPDSNQTHPKAKKDRRSSFPRLLCVVTFCSSFFSLVLLFLVFILIIICTDGQ